MPPTGEQPETGGQQHRRPTKDELAAAAGHRVHDVIAEDLNILFCGINPGLWSAAVDHHFARPGNRFWKALHLSGLTPEVFEPSEEERLLELGLGITNLVARASATAAELSRQELQFGARRLTATAARWKPRFVAVVGMGAYRTAFSRPRATVGEQPELIAAATLWLLPNPSGLQATYQMPELVAAFQALRFAALGRTRHT